MGVVKVAGLWETGWSAPLTEHDWWDMVMRDFCVDQHYMSPISGIDRKDRLFEAAHIEEVLDANRDLTIVFVDERADVPLRDFEHPEGALYVLGKVSYSGFLSHRRAGDQAVRIETNANLGLLWPHQAAAIVLYDRGVKRQWR